MDIHLKTMLGKTVSPNHMWFNIKGIKNKIIIWLTDDDLYLNKNNHF